MKLQSVWMVWSAPLIDSGAQMSTITVSFAKHLSLLIKQFGKVMSIEVAEGKFLIWNM